MLNASEIWWSGKPVSGNKRPDSENLIEEAEAAAIRTGNKSLIARVKYLKGKIYITTNTIETAAQLLKEALQTAQDAQDPLAEFFIKSELGYRIRGMSNTDGNGIFNYGLDLQYKAYDLFQSRLKSLLKPDTTIDMNRHFYLLKSRIGIGEFDRGNYGEAIKWISDSINGINQLKTRQDLSWPLNYLGQVYTAIGQFEQAEKVFEESIDLYKGEDHISIRGYTLESLGKLYMEWGRIKDAENYLIEGWKETQDAWMVPLVIIGRIYYVELLMHPKYNGHDLPTAGRLLSTTIAEIEASKFYDKKINVFFLFGKLALIQGDISSAVEYSTKAVDYLEKMGTVPLVRTEEVFFNHYNILKAAGYTQNYLKPYLDQAYKIIQEKALSLENGNYKHTFLDRVPLSHNILSEFSSLNEHTSL